MLKRRHGMAAIELTIVIIFITIFLSWTSHSIGTIQKTISANNLKDQAIIMDTAIGIWYSSHDGQYPNDLTTLTNMGFLPQKMSLSSFSYSIQSNKTQYNLTTNLPTGISYKSPGSKF